MADVVNLRMARKAKARAAAERAAAEARALHGSTRAERAGTAARVAALRSVVDGARREPGSTDDKGGEE